MNTDSHTATVHALDNTQLKEHIVKMRNQSMENMKAIQIQLFNLSSNADSNKNGDKVNTFSLPPLLSEDELNLPVRDENEVKVADNDDGNGDVDHDDSEELFGPFDDGTELGLVSDDDAEELFGPGNQHHDRNTTLG